MKRYTNIIGLLALFLFVGVGYASAGAPLWTLNAPNSITFMCGGSPYAHTLDTAVNNPDGSFTGEGYYNANAGYTWDISGDIDGDVITFAIVYTGINSGYTLNGDGVVSGDGSISGSVDGNCDTFSMPAGSATLIPVVAVLTDKGQCKKGGWEDFGFRNQGQCIRFVNTGKDSR